jgi:hypothetical protein
MLSGGFDFRGASLFVGHNGGMDVGACQLCGRESNPAEDGDAPLTWVMDRSGDRVSWTCPRCAVDNVRSMEAKLEPEWW